MSLRLTHPLTSQNTFWRPTCKARWLTESWWTQKTERRKMILPKIIFFVTMASSTHPDVPTFTSLFFLRPFHLALPDIHATWPSFAHNSCVICFGSIIVDIIVLWNFGRIIIDIIVLWKEKKGVHNYGRKLILTYFFSYAQLGNRVVYMDGQKLSINSFHTK